MLLAQTLLTCCVMQTHHDTHSTLTPNPDEHGFRRGEFLGTATFLKPVFRIAVAPRSGELQVKVELNKADAKARWSRAGASRH